MKIYEFNFYEILRALVNFVLLATRKIWRCVNFVFFNNFLFCFLWFFYLSFLDFCDIFMWIFIVTLLLNFLWFIAVSRYFWNCFLRIQHIIYLKNCLKIMQYIYPERGMFSTRLKFLASLVCCTMNSFTMLSGTFIRIWSKTWRHSSNI